ncbi:MAG: TRAP transporter TatT component family protein [Treponema sp.]|nr:TRAP transporter TatT component family protein [Treponema sp.]
MGCSINTLVANALTGEGSSTVFTGDSDPQLVGDALPFAMKMYEALLDATPKHRGLMLFTGSLFIMYANAFVQGPAQMLPGEAFELREQEEMRAKKLYLRGLAMMYNGLEVKYKGFINAAQKEETLQAMLQKVKKDDVGFLYWAAAGGMAAYSIDVLDYDLNARIPEWKAMALRAYELDPDFDGAALDEFLFLLYISLPDMLGGSRERALEHYQKAIEKTGGKSSSIYISYAESICVPDQDYELYQEYLEKVLAIDPDEDISTRLVTIINQRRARWLLDNAYLNFSFLPSPGYY